MPPTPHTIPPTIPRAIATTLAALCIAAGSTTAQTMTYQWTVTTDNGGTNLEPGESAYLTLTATMDPEVTGFAGTIFDIRGIENWNTGSVDSYWNTFWAIESDNGDLQSNNDITGIQSYQLPPAFNQDFIADNPVLLYQITWSTNDYTPRVIEVGDANHLNNDVYTDDFGTSVPYQGIPGTARFTVGIPTPGTLPLLALATLTTLRPRRPHTHPNPPLG
ncbi:MAG: hypothetical protein Q9O74_05335 [Planctomycetota bacterium]|nr:hypothetical protein [Planctomycetota bacterium]